MEMEAFLAQSPDADHLHDLLTAATLSLSMANRCLTGPGPGTATTADLHQYLTAALDQLETARALVPRA